jgi:hypothetical protein
MSGLDCDAEKRGHLRKQLEQLDYRSFFQARQAAGYNGYVAYEMCSALGGGGSGQNLDRCARRFLDYMASI